MVNRDFKLAQEAQDIAEPLIARYHKHLTGIPVEYWFCSKEMKSKGKTVWAQAKKLSGLAGQMLAEARQYELNEFFVVQINAEIWQFIDVKQRTALIDHELCHFWAEEDEETGGSKLSLLPHDLEEFACIITRHGPKWNSDLEAFIKVVNKAQLAFPDEADAEPYPLNQKRTAQG